MKGKKTAKKKIGLPAGLDMRGSLRKGG